MKKNLFLIALIGIFGFGWYYLSGLDKGILPDTKRSLEQEGAAVQRTGLVLATDCKKSKLPQCDNFANTDALYLGGLVPCNENGLIALCNEANDKPVPLIKKVLSWQLGENEAVVLYGPLPPTETYFSIELLLYERHREHLSNAAGFVPPVKGESVPEPTMDGRYVIDASVGDSYNHRVLKTGTLDEPGGADNFAMVISGNRIVMQRVVNNLLDNGYPESAINRVELPESYVFGLDEKADTFRLVGRIARPFDEAAMTGFLRESLFQYKLWRVTFDPATTGVELYPTPDCSNLKNQKGILPVPCHKDRKLPGAELTGGQDLAYSQFKQSVKHKLGEPTRILQPVYRRYDDEFCLATGTYCWGNNNDATYVNINDPETDALAFFDLSSPSSKVVIAGIDHQLAGWADMWNLGYFDPDGATLGSINFADVQKNNYASLDSNIDGKAFYVQLKENCGPEDQYCYNINFKKGADKIFALMNRIYLNPRTATGPDGAQTAMPVIYIYE